MSDEPGTPILSSPPEWLCGHASFDGTYLSLDASRARRYAPYEVAESLPFDLAGIREPQDALSFIQKYGLLWHGPDATEHVEKFTDWEREIRVLNSVLILHQALQGTVAGDAESRRTLRELIDLAQSIFQNRARSDDEYARHAAVLVAHWVTEGMAGVAVGVTTAGLWEGGDPSRFIFMATSPSLVGYAYHCLAARVIVERIPLRACLECRRFFPVWNVRQQYCDSRCGSRARQRRFAEKQEDTS